MTNKDEYINSLLLTLFLMQGEINRLNETLDLARKGELVYINNPQIEELKAYKDINEDFKTAWEELKAENERLREENYQLQKDCQICENFIDFIPCKPIRDMDYDLQKVISQRDNYYQTLQEIKAIANNYIKGCVDCSLIAEPYECEDCTDGGMAKLGKKIIDLITKAEEE